MEKLNSCEPVRKYKTDISFVCHAKSCVNTRPGAGMYTYSSGTNVWFSPLWAAINSRLNSPVVDYYSCQLQGHMWRTYTQQGVSSCNTLTLLSARQENYGRCAEKIPLTLCGHTCTHCAVNAASCCCKSHQHRMFFFFLSLQVAMKKPTRAVLVLFPLCHASFFGCLIAPQRH